MFNRKEVKKRGMKLISENILFFLVMSFLTIVFSFVPFIGIALVMYFIIRKSFNIVSGIDSKWFEFDSESFVNFFALYLLKLFSIRILFIIVSQIIFLILILITGKLSGFDVGLGLLFMMASFFLASIIFFILGHLIFFSDYIAVEYPKVGVKNFIVFSYILTKGQVKNLLVFSFSFILFYLLVVITFGIAKFFVEGYISLSKVCLYNELKSKSPKFNEAISKYGYTSY